MERSLRNARARRMLYLLDIKCLPDESIKENVEYNQSEETYRENESPLPSGANYTNDQLSVLDDIDFEDNERILENMPSNASIFPDHIFDSPSASTCTNNQPTSSPSIIENSRNTSPISVTGFITKTTTPMPSPAVSFSNATSPINVSTTIPNSPMTPISYAEDIESSPNTQSQSDSQYKRRINVRKDKGRLREIFSQEWKDNQRKYKLNRGLEYTTRKGKVNPRKQLKPPCPQGCRQKCYDKITEENRKQIFDLFWSIGDHSRQWDFITKYVEKTLKVRVISENSKRLHTFKYSLPNLEPVDNVNITKIPVCKIMFLRTLSISYNFVYTALGKLDSGNGFVESDQRGKHLNNPKIISPDMMRSVIDHVEAFSPVEAHHTRKNSNRKYLDGSLSFPKMFNLYKEWFDPVIYTVPVSNVRQYRDIVNKNFNVSFHKPKKDKCEECHIFENKKHVTEEEKEKQEMHLKEKDLARKFKAQDKELASRNKEVLSACFDLQKCLNVPHGNVSTFYYKRKLSLYNFTIFNMTSLQGFCYSWHQQTGKRGANEIASYVYRFIETTVSKGFKDYRFWSDNCGGQNRNRIVFLMYMYACYKFKISITHRFLVVGHTQNEGDSMHALIEKQTRDKVIYTPDQWYAAFRWAKTDGKPYVVTEVSQEMILDFKVHLKRCNNWTASGDGTNVSWNKVCEIRIEENEPYKILFKYKFENDSHNWINCRNKPKNTRNQRVNDMDLLLTPAYEKPLPIDKNKHKDVMNLCQSEVIPKEYHLFYKTLIASDTTSNDGNSDVD